MNIWQNLDLGAQTNPLKRYTKDWFEFTGLNHINIGARLHVAKDKNFRSPSVKAIDVRGWFIWTQRLIKSVRFLHLFGENFLYAERPDFKLKIRPFWWHVAAPKEKQKQTLFANFMAIVNFLETHFLSLQFQGEPQLTFLNKGRKTRKLNFCG